MDKDTSKYSVIARCLQYASGSLPLDQEGKLILINEVENELEESLMEGENLQDTNCIAEDVRTKSPAAYLYADKSQRRVFFANRENILTCYACDDSGKRWSEFDLGPAAGNELHPNSGLCACFTPEGFRVYFQDPLGALKGIAMQNDTLSTLDVVEVDAMIGTPLSVACSRDGSPTLYLYYMNLDGFLHYTMSDLSGGEWKDTLFPGSNFTDTVEKFITFRGETDAEFEGFFLSADKVFQVDSAGKKVELGSVVRESGDFIPSKTEQMFCPGYHPLLLGRRGGGAWAWGGTGGGASVVAHNNNRSNFRNNYSHHNNNITYHIHHHYGVGF